MATAALKSAIDPQRRALIAKVHIAPKQLGMTDEDYRAVMHRVTGQMSARDCTVPQLQALVDEFARRGFTTKACAPNRKGAPRRADHPMARKARAMWISLGLLCAIRDGSEPALEAFARRQTGCERFQWVNQSQSDRLIEALKAMAERHGWTQALPRLAKVHHVHALKGRLCEAILAKLVRAGVVPSHWGLGRAAWELCKLSDPDQHLFATEDYDRIAHALGRVLRAEGGASAFDEVKA
ncbi:Mu-like prophage protein gp16 [Sphingobium faniae]|nr:Mu-like prophage protein gp16 [Sphingobium faniae]